MIIAVALLLTALPAAAAPALRLTADSSEATLRARLSSESGWQDFEYFYYADYDGDGSFEAFALAGEFDGEVSYAGDLWFVSVNGCRRLQQGLAYEDMEMLGNPPTMIFHAEEGYGGSGSTSHLWQVEGGEAVAVSAPASGDMEWAGGNDYYGFPDAFDMDDDGTGHTWKRYYFFMDGGALREYGGIPISIDELCEFEGVQEVLGPLLGQGYAIGDILYRANGVINVNLDRGSENHNLSLRYDETRVYYWEEDAGVYLAASDPSIAVYPVAFVHPTGAGGEPPHAVAPVEDAAPGGGAEIDPPTGAVVSGEYDLDGDGAPETFLLYKTSGVSEYDTPQSEIHLQMRAADGSFLADGEVYACPELPGSDQHYLLYGLDGGFVYLHAQFGFEGTQSNYIVLRPSDGSWVEQINIEDPAYSDAAGLRVHDTYEDVYYSEDYRDTCGPEFLAALDGCFAEYGLHFEANGVIACAALPAEQRILEAGSADIAAGASVPAEDGGYDDAADDGDYGGSTAYAYVTGDVKLRDGPGLDCGQVGVIYAGSTVEYLGDSSVDDRGVAWYHVRYDGMEGWASSKYVSLQ